LNGTLLCAVNLSSPVVGRPKESTSR
jgi:hypothetical protein